MSKALDDRGRGPQSIAAALGAAALFSASTPVAKALVADVHPVVLAGLLYLGSGFGLLALRARAWLRPGGTGRLNTSFRTCPASTTGTNTSSRGTAARRTSTRIGTWGSRTPIPTIRTCIIAMCTEPRPLVRIIVVAMTVLTPFGAHAHGAARDEQTGVRPMAQTEFGRTAYARERRMIGRITVR